jgi:hypothetical protein
LNCRSSLLVPCSGLAPLRTSCVFTLIGLTASINTRGVNQNTLSCGCVERRENKIVLGFQKVLAEQRCWLLLGLTEKRRNKGFWRRLRGENIISRCDAGAQGKGTRKICPLLLVSHVLPQGESLSSEIALHRGFVSSRFCCRTRINP